MLVPMVLDKTTSGERAYDIYSRMLVDRTIMLTGPIDDNVSSLVISQLLFLESQDLEKPIHLYINSPGGSVSAGLAIIDTMTYISSPVSTICVGTAASMGAVILSAGEKGMRYALPNSEVMLHQPLGQTGGSTSDILIHAKRIERARENLNRLLSQYSKHPYEKICQDTDRDLFLTAAESLEYGIIDKILTQRQTTTKAG